MTSNMKGYALTVVGIGGGITSFFLVWNSWLSTQVIQSKVDTASLITSVGDIKETVNKIAKHEGLLASVAPATTTGPAIISTIRP